MDGSGTHFWLELSRGHSNVSELDALEVDRLALDAGDRLRAVHKHAVLVEHIDDRAELASLRTVRHHADAAKLNKARETWRHQKLRGRRRQSADGAVSRRDAARRGRRVAEGSGATAAARQSTGCGRPFTFC